MVPVPAEYSVGEGYYYFNADMKFGVENESQLRMVSDFVTLLGRQTGFIQKDAQNQKEPKTNAFLIFISTIHRFTCGSGSSRVFGR